MYKSELPKNCPPSDVEQQELSLYRLISPDDLTESFKNHVELDKDNVAYKTNCKAYALSFFDNIEKVKDLLSKENNEGKIIAKINIKKEYGVLSKKPSKTQILPNTLLSGLRSSPKEFEAIANQTEALILDVRNEAEFVKEHIPSSIFIGLHGQFAPWVGALIRDTKQPILLVTPEGLEVETITRLSRVGFDNTLGYLKGGLTAWKSAGFETDTIDSIAPEVFASKYENAIVIDARKPSEFKAEHVESAVNIPLDYVNEQLAEVPKEDTFFLHCAGGYRSVIMASILKARGYHNMINVEKGMAGIRTTDVPLTAFVCPSTLK